MECTQVLLSESFTEEINSTYIKLPVATLEIDGEYFTIFNSENVIGRDDSCSITIKNSAVSSKHAVIDAEDPRAHVLFDVGSTNKTKLGKMTLKPNVRYVINDGDTITFGNVTASYNISRQYPNTPEKAVSQSVSETNKDKVDSEKSKTNLLESLNDNEVKDSVLNISDNDLFDDEGRCDSSVVQPEIRGSTEETNAENDIYEIDTVAFDSNEILESKSEDISAPSVCLPSTSGTNEQLKQRKENIFVCDSQSDSENIYDSSAQNFRGSEESNKLDCDSSVSIGTDKQQMEVSSSSSDTNKQDIDCEDQDTNVYDMQTQNPFVDETQISKDDTLFTKDRSKSNFEWEDFPEIELPDVLDTSNPDNTDFSRPNKLEECNLIDVGQSINNENTIKSSDKLDENCTNYRGIVNSEVDLDNDLLYPASQNIDMFETSKDSKENLESYNEAEHFCEPSDVSINELTVIESFKNLKDSKLSEEEVSYDEACSSVVGNTKVSSTLKTFAEEANFFLNKEDEPSSSIVAPPQDASYTDYVTSLNSPNNYNKEIKSSVCTLEKIHGEKNDEIKTSYVDTTHISNDCIRPIISESEPILNKEQKSEYFDVASDISRINFNDLKGIENIKVKSPILPETLLKDSSKDIGDPGKIIPKNNKFTELITDSTLNSSVASDFYELATQPVEDHPLPKPTLTLCEDTNMTNEKEQSNKNDNKSAEVKVNSSSMDNFFDLDTEPIAVCNFNHEPQNKDKVPLDDSELLEDRNEDYEKITYSNDANSKSSLPGECLDNSPPKDELAIVSSGVSISNECDNNKEKLLNKINDDNALLDTSLPDNFYDLATQPVSTDNHIAKPHIPTVSRNVTDTIGVSTTVTLQEEEIANNGNIPKVNDSGNALLFELDTQPVSDNFKHPTNTACTSDISKSDIDDECRINSEDNKTSNVTDSSFITDDFYDLATQPVSSDNLITNNDLITTTSENNSEKVGVCTLQKGEIANNEKITEVNDSADTLFFELDSQPISNNFQHPTNTTCTSDISKIAGVDNNECIDDKCTITSEDNKTSNVTESSFIADNFFELSTQAVAEDDHLAVTTSNKIMLDNNKQCINDEPNVVLDSSIKQSFYEVATQKVLKDDHIAEPTSTSAIPTECVKENISISDDCKERMKEIKDNLNTSVSSDFYELGTQKVSDDNLAEPTSTVVISADDAKVVVSDSDNEENKHQPTKVLHMNNSVLKNFFESATQEASKSDANRFAEASSSENIFTENKIVLISGQEDKPVESDLIASNDFFELSTQLVQDDTCNTSELSKEEGQKNTSMDVNNFNKVGGNVVPVIDEVESLTPNKENNSLKVSHNLLAVTVETSTVDRNNYEVNVKETGCSSNINNYDKSEKKYKISDESAISTARPHVPENVSEISSSDGMQSNSQPTKLENDIDSSNRGEKTNITCLEVNKSPYDKPVSTQHSEDNTDQTTAPFLKTVDMKPADDNREVTMELSESICTVQEKKVNSCLPDKSQNVESSNDTMIDNASMSITCIVASDTSIDVPQQNKNVNINRPLLVDDTKLPKKTKVQQSSVEDLLKILQGDDEERGTTEEVTNENNESSLTTVRKRRSTSKKVAKQTGKQTTVTKTKSKPEKAVSIESSSIECSPVLRTYSGKKRSKIDDCDIEENSEDFVFKFKRKGYNVFPDSEDFNSICTSENDLVKNESSSSNKVSLTNKVSRTNFQNSFPICPIVSDTKENNESSEELVLKFKHKGCNVFPPDSESFAPEKSDSKFDSESIKEISTDNTSDSPKLKENGNESSNKKSKILSDREYISRGNITLHSQEVLEELEEQFRLTAVAMSPTQLSVVSDSDDGNKSDNNVTPAKVRRSGRKQNTLYKPLVSPGKNNLDHLQRKPKKWESNKENDQVKSSLDMGGNAKNSSSNDSPKTTTDEVAENSKDQNFTKSVKPFVKASPTDKYLPISTNVNEKSVNLFDSEQDPIDFNDSQNSINLDDSESQELGRGKRKRFRISFEGFMTDEDFKKTRKKLSSSPNPSSQTMRASEEIKEKLVQSPIGNSPNDVNAKSSSFTTSQGVDKSDEVLTTPKSNTKNLKNVRKANINVPENLNKKEKDNTTANESDNKSNSYSLCDKLDELFNIWGPADTVKLSPRAAKLTSKTTKNRSNLKSKGQSSKNSQNNASNSEKVSVIKITNNKNSQAIKNKNLEVKAGTSKSNNSSSHKSATKHKLNENESSGPLEKKSKRKMSNSESDSVNSSESSIATRKSGRLSNPNTDNAKTRSRQNSSNANTSKGETSKNVSIINSSDTKNRSRRNSSNSNASKEETSKNVSDTSAKNRSRQNSSNSSTNVSGNLRKRSHGSDNNTEGQKKRLLTPKTEVKKTANSKQSGSKVASNSFDTDPFSIMSQEFSFGEVKSDRKPAAKKENMKSSQVRRSGRSKNTEKNVKESRHEKVLFTGISDRKLSAIVTKLGGEVVDSPFTCTVLVTDKVRRTAKFLSALSRGLPIVTPQWLIDSKDSNSFSDIQKFMLRDVEAEKLYSFCLKDSLNKALSSKLLAGWSVYVTSSVTPPPEEIKPLVECSGGKCLLKAPARWPPYSLIISCEEDEGDWSTLAKRGKTPPIVGTEALFSGILQQVLDIERYRLM